MSDQPTPAEVAERHGLPATLGGRLQGDTPDELEADAARLATALKAEAAGQPSEGEKFVHELRAAIDKGVTEIPGLLDR